MRRKERGATSSGRRSSATTFPTAVTSPTTSCGQTQVGREGRRRRPIHLVEKAWSRISSNDRYMGETKKNQRSRRPVPNQSSGDGRRADASASR